jgi:hypothetical protein
VNPRFIRRAKRSVDQQPHSQVHFSLPY